MNLNLQHLLLQIEYKDIIFMRYNKNLPHRVQRWSDFFKRKIKYIDQYQPYSKECFGSVRLNQYSFSKIFPILLNIENLITQVVARLADRMINWHYLSYNFSLYFNLIDFYFNNSLLRVSSVPKISKKLY